jgi:hypothetical protein
MENPKIEIRCSHCQYRQIITDGTSGDFVQIACADIPKRANGTSQETFKRAKMFRCPKCGFATRASKLPDVEPKKEPTNNSQTTLPSLQVELPKDDDFMKKIDNLMKKREGGKIQKEKK